MRGPTKGAGWLAVAAALLSWAPGARAAAAAAKETCAAQPRAVAASVFMQHTVSRRRAPAVAEDGYLAVKGNITTDLGAVQARTAMQRSDGGRGPAAGGLAAPGATAVCVLGAARSLYLPEVRVNHERMLFGEARRQLGWEPDTFYHLFVGQETSLRGQNKMSEREADGMLRALENASRVRFQMQENDFTCHSMATGRWFKYSRCAEMIRDTGRAYRVMLFMRPDIAISQPAPVFARLARGIIPNGTEFAVNCADEAQLLSWFFLDAALTAEQAECCDAKHRTPAPCFINGLEEPRPNYMLEAHFERWQKRAAREGFLVVRDEKSESGPGCVQHRIVRIPEFEEITHGKSARSLHGKVKDSTRQYKAPRMSRVYDWRAMGQAERRRAYLEAVAEAQL